MSFRILWLVLCCFISLSHGGDHGVWAEESLDLTIVPGVPSSPFITDVRVPSSSSSSSSSSLTSLLIWFYPPRFSGFESKIYDDHNLTYTVIVNNDILGMECLDTSHMLQQQQAGKKRKRMIIIDSERQDCNWNPEQMRASASSISTAPPLFVALTASNIKGSSTASYWQGRLLRATDAQLQSISYDPDNNNAPSLSSSSPSSSSSSSSSTLLLSILVPIMVLVGIGVGVGGTLLWKNSKNKTNSITKVECTNGWTVNPALHSSTPASAVELEP